MKTLLAQIQLRHGTAAEWAAVNPVPMLGEFCYETDTKRLKIGDGVHAWNDPLLTYFGGGGGGVTDHALLSNLTYPAGHTGFCADGDARLSNARTPTAHKTSHEPSGSDAMTVDAAAATGSLRTLGTSATAACAGNDSRLSDARTPAAHKTSHEPGGGDAMAVDAAAGTGSLRTLGTGATAACAGNDARLSDARTPSAHATSHKSGGGDAVKLDELAAPTDITTLDASTTLHGLAPKASAPGAGLLSVLAIANGETARTDKAIFDTTNPAALGTAGPGTQLVAARRDHVHALPAIDATAAASDITDRNVSTSAHGLVPKAPNNTYQMLRADASWARPRASAYATASSATPTPDADVYDTYCLTALAEAAVFGAPTGTPVNGQKLMIRILDNGTARGLTWNAIYVARGAALPSTTVLGKYMYLGFSYNSAATTWDCVAVSNEA